MFSLEVLGLFIPMFIIYGGLSFIFGNSSALALKFSEDKSNASALMSFINMSLAVIVVLLLSIFPSQNILLLPLLYTLYMGFGALWFMFILRQDQGIR